MKKTDPFLLKPAAKDYIWGGNRIKSVFSKDIELTPLAETWECSVHPDGPSVVAEGQFAGMTLKSVLDAHPEFCGREREEFPILIKFIDAEKRLSVQVHPDDDYAFRNENGQKGKTECWIVIDAEPGAKLVFGLKEEMSAEDIIASAADGTIEEKLNFIPVVAGDVIPVPAGTVHAIGAGILLAEIQQNSNLTYRLYDWGRLGKDGKPRELHAKKAADVIRAPAEIPETGIERDTVPLSETVCSNECFKVDRMILTGISAQIPLTGDSFSVLLCTKGRGAVKTDGTEKPFSAGDCIFFPASDEPAYVSGDGEILISRFPDKQ
ncbi:MAG: class I mannose-6-phosphate isomerase [Clostridia bacterium]|nr:class I mannose-6-phosphate isomerase [Clostridia bacterium]